MNLAILVACLTRSKGNTEYLLDVGSRKVPVYCHMTMQDLNACKGGGWTLVMKINGSKVLKVKCLKADKLRGRSSTSLLPLLRTTFNASQSKMQGVQCFSV